MAKPIILAVDDEPAVLNAVARDLRQQYGENYRILRASSGSDALETVKELKQRNENLALFLVDQRMPGMSGVEFLRQAIQFYPGAAKVLLTAYADTEAAIVSINEIALDYYLMKPWDPPEQRLYPILDDLLSDWLANLPEPEPDVRVAGTLWSPSSHMVKDFLARNQIPYAWLDIDRDEQARKLVEATLEGSEWRLPVVFFSDGDVLVQPNNADLARKLGLHTTAALPFYDLIIIGAGPAGLGAAVYGASEGLKTLLIEREATGGQAGTSSRIENYLGFPRGLSGADLARRATVQARRLGAEILTAVEAVGVRVEGSYKYVRLANDLELGCRALIIATGVSVRALDAPGVERLTGAGVYYGAALTEAAYYRGEHILVVGGGNSAGQGAMFFSRYASRVSIVARSSTLARGMSQYLIDQVEAAENIDVLCKTEVVEAHGKDRLEAVTLRSVDTGETWECSTPAMFIFIGARAHSELVQGVLETNQAGFILTGSDLYQNGRRPKSWKLRRDPYPLETSIPGIFAAGDVRHGAIRRVASAVGEGAIAINLVHQYLKTV